MTLNHEQSQQVGTTVGVAANNAATVIASTLAEGFNLDDPKYITNAYAELVDGFATVIAMQREKTAGLLGFVEAFPGTTTAPAPAAQPSAIPPQPEAPAYAPAVQQAVPPAQPPQYTQTSDGDGDPAMDALWREFFADPTAFYDNRTSKKNPNGPDFAHKTKTDAKGYKQGLWIIDRYGKNPSWVPAALAQAGY